MNQIEISEELVDIDTNSFTNENEYRDKVEYLEALVRKYKFDCLTGLMGKIDYIEKMDRLFGCYKFSNEEFYFGLIDIDNLHNINKRKGYRYGDKIIKDVSEDLKRSFHCNQIFRISGDEFVILIRKFHLSLEETIQRLDTVKNVTYVVDNIKRYSNPKQMFRSLDKQLTLKKSIEKRL